MTFRFKTAEHQLQGEIVSILVATGGLGQEIEIEGQSCQTQIGDCGHQIEIGIGRQNPELWVEKHKYP